MRKSFLFKMTPFILMLGSSTALGGDWLEHRGPGGQGLTELDSAPTKWSEDKGYLWRSAIEGKAWSTPLVKDGKIYLTNAVGEEKISLRALCLKLSDGSVLWDKEIFPFKGEPIMHKKNSHASSSPIIEGDRLYVHFGYQGTACLDLEGNTLWSSRELYFDPTHGNGGSPAIIEDMLVFTCDGQEVAFVAALDKHTGKVKWKTDRHTGYEKMFSFGTPLLIDVKGEKQIVTQASGAVFGYDLKGNELWKYSYDGYSVVPKPMYANGLVYVSSGYNRATLYAFKPEGRGDLTDKTLAWKYQGDVPKNSSFLLIDQKLYLQSDKGTVTCLDALSGEEVYVEKRKIRNSSASPIYAGGHMYFTDERGKTLVVKPGETFQLVETNEIGEPVLASMAAVDNKILLRTENALYCLQ